MNREKIASGRTELEEDGGEMLGGGLVDDLPNGGAASEADVVPLHVQQRRT